MSAPSSTGRMLHTMLPSQGSVCRANTDTARTALSAGRRRKRPGERGSGADRLGRANTDTARTALSAGRRLQTCSIPKAMVMCRANAETARTAFPAGRRLVKRPLPKTASAGRTRTRHEPPSLPGEASPPCSIPQTILRCWANAETARSAFPAERRPPRRAKTSLSGEDLPAGRRRSHSHFPPLSGQ